MNQDWENEILKLLSESGKALDSFEIAEKTNLDMRALQPILNTLAASGQAALTKRANMRCRKHSGSSAQRRMRCETERRSPNR